MTTRHTTAPGRRRRSIAGALVFALTSTLAGGCVVTDGDSPGNDPVEDPSAPPVVVDEDQVMDTAEIGALTVRAGATLYVAVEQLEIHGDLVVEEGAAVEGTGTLAIVVHGEVRHEGVIRSPGDLVLVDDAERLPSADLLSSPNEESDVSVADPSEPTAETTTWHLLGELEAGAAGMQAMKLDRGREGKRGSTIFISTGRFARIAPKPGVARRTFSIPDGKPGEDRAGCDQQGGDGGRGGKLFLYARGLRLQSVDFEGGNGGPGGEAAGVDCDDGQQNVGGAGALPGTLKIRAEKYLVIDGLVTFDGFDGGDGGPASITGRAGDPGATVMAHGGSGADIDGYRLNVAGLAFAGLFSEVELSIGQAGAGGPANAVGGPGIPGTCAAPAGNGGKGLGEGGRGGSVSLVSVSTVEGVSLTDSFRAGDGGGADGRGGPGGKGADCPDIGGDGGHGGDGQAVHGVGGASSHGDAGEDGAETDAGGRGGDGGEAWDQWCMAFGGHGGHGGNARVGVAGDGGHGGDATCTPDGPMFPRMPGGFGGNGGRGGDSEQDQAGDGGDAGCPQGHPGPAGAGPVVGSSGASCP